MSRALASQSTYNLPRPSTTTTSVWRNLNGRRHAPRTPTLRFIIPQKLLHSILDAFRLDFHLFVHDLICVYFGPSESRLDVTIWRRFSPIHADFCLTYIQLELLVDLQPFTSISTCRSFPPMGGAFLKIPVDLRLRPWFGSLLFQSLSHPCVCAGLDLAPFPF